MRLLGWIAGIVLLILAALPLAAHPLPSSTLTYRLEATGVELTLTIPLHELALAFPAVKVLGQTPTEGAITGDLLAQLRPYFAKHLGLVTADQTPVVLTLSAARIAGAEHEDIGHYALLVVDLAAALPSGSSIFPARLHYDAVLHEVRNHRAEVFSQSHGQEPKLRGEIRFDPDLGAATVLDLPQP